VNEIDIYTCQAMMNETDMNKWKMEQLDQVDNGAVWSGNWNNGLCEISHELIFPEAVGIRFWSGSGFVAEGHQWKQSQKSDAILIRISE
jgi:hypothetical protein